MQRVVPNLQYCRACWIVLLQQFSLSRFLLSHDLGESGDPVIGGSGDLWDEPDFGSLFHYPDKLVLSLTKADLADWPLFPVHQGVEAKLKLCLVRREPEAWSTSANAR